MILFGCLLALGMSVAPRLFLVLAWLFSERWALVWKDEFLLPLLGIILLPFTTIMFMLTVTIGLNGEVQDLAGSDFLWLLLGLLLDLAKWGQVLTNRKAGQSYATQYYPAGAPGSSTIRSDSAAVTAAEVSTGSVPTSASPAAPAEASKDDGAPSGGGSS
jgi:hypothetical protein